VTTFNSDIVLGDEYEDTQTGYTGIATSIHFYQYACERITIEAYDDKSKEVRELTFDAPRLRHMESGKIAETTRTGGPARAGETRSVVSR
jgi:hypothetical protein